MQVYDKAHELAKAMKNSPEFAKYQEYIQKIAENPADKQRLEEYKKMRFEVQSLYMAGEKPAVEKLEQFQKLGELLQFNADISGYIAAEYKLNQMVSDVFKIISDAVDLKLDFLEE